MNGVPKTLSDLEACPYCGHHACYTKDWVEGSSRTLMDFNMNPLHDPKVYQNVTHTCGSRVYCDKCDAHLGDKKSNTLSSATLKYIAKNSQNGAFEYP